MRNISFSLTTPQFLDGTKDVTRRFGWWFLKQGDRLRAVEKSMGLKAGEKIKPLGVIEIISTRAEPLDTVTKNLDYGFEEIRREGYPFGTEWPSVFVETLCGHYGVKPDAICNRIEFKRVST